MPRKEHRGAMAGGGPQITPWPSSSQACHGSHQPITGSSPEAQKSREAQGQAGTQIMDSEEGTPRAVIGPRCLGASKCRDKWVKGCASHRSGTGGQRPVCLWCQQLEEICLSQRGAGWDHWCFLCSHECSVCLCWSVWSVVYVCACWEYTLSINTGWTWGCGAAAASPLSGCWIWPDFSLKFFFWASLLPYRTS